MKFSFLKYERKFGYLAQLTILKRYVRRSIESIFQKGRPKLLDSTRDKRKIIFKK